MWRRAALILLLQCSAWAEKPTFDAVFPVAAARGATNTLTLAGKFEPWPPKIWSSGAGLAFNFETNKGKVQITVSPDAPAGARLLRLFNDDGASDPRFFIVTEQSEELEREPNDHFAKASVITNIPLTINGRLEKNGDVDSFALNLKAGQWLDASVESYTLMSKLDPVLRLLTTNGFQLAWNHDFSSLDPRLIWRSPQDQTVILQIFGFVYPANAEIQLSGGSGGFYRLHVSAGAKSVSQATNAPVLNLGETIAGSFCGGGKTNQYHFASKKDHWIEFRVAAAEIGSPLDPWISISDSSGKELARNDDSGGTRDARLEWKAPADADYILTAGSVTASPREDYRYQISARELKPAYTATVAESSFAIAPGETNQVKLNVKRLRGFTNELSFAFGKLPDGVASDGPRVDAKGGEITLSLVAPTNAPPSSQSFQLIAKDVQTAEENPVAFELVSRSENNGVPGGYSKLLIESLNELWLTVRPKK